MSQSTGAGSQVVDLTLSVPAHGDLRGIAADVVAKIAEYLGGGAAAAAAALERAAAEVAPPDADATIAFELRTEDRELLIHARCGNRTSEVRHRLNS